MLEDFTVEQQQLQLPGAAVQLLHGIMPQNTVVDLTVNMALTRCHHSTAMSVLICAPVFSVDKVCDKDPVAWRVMCRSGCLRGHVLGAADLFDVATIRQLAQHLQVLAGAVATQPDISVSSLPLMSAAEQQLVLHTFNDTAGPLPTLCVHQFFEQQAARTPVAKCLMAGAGGISLTYAEVNSRANQLAHHLIVAGVSADTPVAVLMDKCFEAYIALVAILKAGGKQLLALSIVHTSLHEDLLQTVVKASVSHAISVPLLSVYINAALLRMCNHHEMQHAHPCAGCYLPVDHTAPVERVHSILRLSGCRLLITQQSIAPAAEQLPPAVDVLVADKGWQQFGSGPVTNPETRSNIHSLLYINFTSGSTGEPKGIPVEHLGRRSLCVDHRRPQHVCSQKRESDE